MKFVDEIILKVCSGAGGNGVVRWLSYRGKPKGGPAGGNGGDGGDIYVRAVCDIAVLSKYRGNNKFCAGRGEDGLGSSLNGKNGEDVVIDLPVGSVAEVRATGKRVELLHPGEMIKILNGGRGGLGNKHFKSSRNVSPKEQTDGKSGMCSDLSVELQLIADIGIIGLPNAGKSSLLNSLTRANSKIGNYQFTTLEPNLGIMYHKNIPGGSMVLADIPGLIQGASAGKGLGTKFLKHIMRTNTLIHCISVERDNLKEAYLTIRSEIGAYNDNLNKKREIIVLTKTDLVSDRSINELVSKIKKFTTKPDILSVSVESKDSVDKFKDKLVNLLFCK